MTGSGQGFVRRSGSRLSSQQQVAAETEFTGWRLAANDAKWFTKINLRAALLAPLRLGEHAFDVAARDGEADADVAGGRLALARTEQDRVDSDDSAVKVDQGPAAVARIDRCVGLDKPPWIALLERPIGRADDPAGDGLAEVERVADGDDVIADLEPGAVPEHQARQVP